MTFSSIAGERCAKVPTAPDSLPTRIVSAASFIRVLLPTNFIVPDREFQSERRGFGMDSVSTPHDDRCFEFMGTVLQNVHQSLQAFKNDRRGFGNLKRHGRIENIG